MRKERFKDSLKILECREPIAFSIANPEPGLEMNTDVYICEN